MNWHVNDAAVTDYVERRCGGAAAASVEAHLVNCAECCRRVAEAVDDPLVDEVWQRVTAAVDRAGAPRTERLLMAIGLPPETTRLVSATSRARMSFFLAALLTVAVAIAAATSDRDTQFGLFLSISALGPLAATALSFGPRVDSAHSLVVTSPVSAWRLVLLRTSAALVPAMAVTGLATLVLHERGWVAMAWLLPGIAMAVVSLALSTWVPVEYAAIGVGGAWLIAPLAASAPASRLVQFAAGPVQVAAVVVAIGAAAVVANRRSLLDFQEV